MIQPESIPPRTVVHALQALVLGALAVLPAKAHDTFMRLDGYFLDPGEAAQVFVFHGTFDESVYRIERSDENRLALAGPSTNSSAVQPSSWSITDYGSRPWVYWQRLKAYLGCLDRRLTSSFIIQPEAEGLHIVGLVLGYGGAAMRPEVFDSYLREVGLSDEPIAQHGFADPTIITERYRKSVKTIVYVGDGGPANPSVVLGHPVEFVPQEDPRTLVPGSNITLQLLSGGVPLRDHPMVYSRQKTAFAGEKPAHHKLRSDAEGRVKLTIESSGVWWTSFVHLKRAEPSDDVMFESEWATLTFEVP